MHDFKYEPVYPASKSDLIKRLASNDPKVVAAALYAAAKYEHDSKWVQDQCLKGLQSSEVLVRWAAATCLGDLAFLRRPLDTALVVPALENAIKDPQISDPARFSLQMIKEFLDI